MRLKGVIVPGALRPRAETSIDQNATLSATVRFERIIETKRIQFLYTRSILRRDRLMKFVTSALCVAVVGIATVPLALAADVNPGFDLLHTAPGAFFDGTGFGLGILPLVGVPLQGSNTDTI